MRITTLMLNESARKAGFPVNRTSLLNYINTGNSQNALVNTLNKKSSTVDTEKKVNYEKLENTADNLYKQADIFMAEGDASIFTQSKDGTLSLDSEKMKTMDADSLEKVLGASGDFVKKTAFLAERISDNAQTNAKSLTNQYDSSGNTYSGTGSRYNFGG